MARDTQEADGPDPRYKNIASSTGKVGHLTGLRFDAISRTYVSEDKNRPLPKWLIDAWILILQRSIDNQKNAQLRLNPPNIAKTFLINGEKIKTPSMTVITYERHLELIKSARVLNELEQMIFSDNKYQELQKVFWGLKDK